MRIPVFLSCPTVLTDAQEEARKLLCEQLQHFHLEPRTLGRTDYPTRNPLYEVLVMAKHCAGGLILGFRQFEAPSSVWKPGTSSAKPVDEPCYFPSEWNNLEAGILYTVGLPLLIFREEGIQGGVFDPGVTDVFVHKMPSPPLSSAQLDGLREVFLSWQTQVRMSYYGRYSHSGGLPTTR